MKTIEVKFTYTEKEYLAASRLLILREKKTLIRLGVFFLLLPAIMAWLFLLADVTLPLWYWLGLLLLAGAGLIYRVFTDVPRRYFRGDPKFRDEYRLTFSDEGVRVQTGQIDSKLGWGLYSGVSESAEMYVLAYGKDTRMMTVVPKRVFKDRSEEEEFRRLLHIHVDGSIPAKLAEGGSNEYVPSKSGPPDWR